MLPYDYDITDKNGGEDAKGSEAEADDGTASMEKSTENTDKITSDAEGHLSLPDQTGDGGNFIAPEADKSEQIRGGLDSNHGEEAKIHEHDVPSPYVEDTPAPHQQTDPEGPEESRQPKEFNPTLPNVDKPSFPPSAPVHPNQPGLPEPPSQYPQPSTGREACQIIATGMNTEMQQHASMLANEALTQ